MKGPFPGAAQEDDGIVADDGSDLLACQQRILAGHAGPVRHDRGVLDSCSELDAHETVGVELALDEQLDGFRAVEVFVGPREDVDPAVDGPVGMKVWLRIDEMHLAPKCLGFSGGELHQAVGRRCGNFFTFPSSGPTDEVLVADM